MRSLPSGLLIPLAGFLSEYYVNPAASDGDGSPSKPFSTVAECFADAAGLGLTAGKIWLPCRKTLTENITAPNGSDWTIASVGGTATITGNLVLSSTVQNIFRLENISVAGSVTGVATGGIGNFFNPTNSHISGPVSLTGATGGFWFCIPNGRVATLFSLGGNFGSTTTITGGLLAENWVFAGAIDVSSSFALTNCALPSAMAIAGVGGSLINCTASAITITGTGSTALRMDSATFARFGIGGLLTPGCDFKTLDNNESKQLTITGTVTGASFTGASGRVPRGMYRASVVQELKTAGTLGTSTAQFNYVDIGGTPRSVPIDTPGLLVTAALGTKSSGSVLVYHDGSTDLTYSFTGITTAGSLDIQAVIAYEKVD